MADSTDNVTPMKGGRNRASIRAAIEGELAAARLKEVQGKLRGLIVDLNKAKDVVSAKEAEITSLYEEYADVLPE